MIIQNQRFEIGRGYVITLQAENEGEIIILESIASNKGEADTEILGDDSNELDISFPMTIE